MTDGWQHTHVGRFRVEGVLGRGGMGVVLRAYDPHLLRSVAIKVLTERKAEVNEGTTVNLRERVDHDGLLDEARALAQITDPNVLAVHEIGNERGQTFLVMELVDGADLRAWLAAAPRSLADIFGVFAQAARGLAAAHERGIIHRDFKPENVLISADGRVRVCDFGIAAFARGSQLVHTGTAGTPRYMAPELWRDQSASVYSDVYAFAATLVESIIGELPVDLAVVDRELARRGVDARLRAVIGRALDPDLTRRPSSIPDIAREFAPRPRPRWVVPVVAGAVVAISFATMTLLLRDADPAVLGGGSCGSASELLAGRWNDRERAAVHAGVSATGVTAGEAADILGRLDDYAHAWQRLYDETCTAAVPAARRPARLACLERRLYELSAYAHALSQSPKRELALGRSNSLPDLGSCIEATQVRLPTDPATRAAVEELTARMFALYDQGLAALGTEGDQAGLLEGREQALALGDVELAVRIDRIRGQLLGNAARYDLAETVFEEAVTLALEHHQDAAAAVTLVEAANISRQRGDLGAAATKLQIAKSYLERSPDATPYSRMQLHRALSRVASERGEYEAAMEELDIAAQAVARMQPRDPLWTAKLVLARAALLDDQGKLAEALRVGRDAEQLLRRLGTQGVPDLDHALALIADLERQRGATDIALKLQHERVSMLEREMPPETPARVHAEGTLGLALLDAGKLDEAKARFAASLERIEHTPALSRMRSDFLGYLARAERLLGNFERARVLVQNAIDAEKQIGREPLVGFHEISYAYLELEAGDFEAAATHVHAAERVLAAEPADHVDQLDIAEVQLTIALGRGKPELADRIASRVLALFAERKIDDARNERFWLGAAAARNLLGRPQEARPLAERALARRKQRNAAPLEVAVAEAELVLASYLIDHSAEDLDRLRGLVTALDDPRARIDHARFVRWFEANQRRP